MKLLTEVKEQLELRKWALEISLEYGDRLFPTADSDWITRPSIVINNAHKIIELVTEKWDEEFIDPPAIFS